MPSLSGGTVSLPVHPDTNGFGKKLSAGVLGESGVIGGLGKHLGGLIVGGLAAAGIGVSIGKILSTGFDEAKDASAGVAQLTAGIVSTGNAAHVSVEGMESLASSIQNMSGQTDDSIVGAQQLLLTFTNIKNVGPNKIFDDATLAAANMAAKMGGDASSQAILLGKALNDPVKGITALTRVGVSFTEGQKKQISAMVDAGNTMGAQKLILGELNKEFGGAAKAAGESLPGQLARTKRAFEDISQSVVEGILPIVTPAIVGISSALQKAAPYVAAFSSAMSVKLTAAAAVFPRIGAAVVGLYKLIAQGDFTGGLRKALGLTEDSRIVGAILGIRSALMTVRDAVKLVAGSFTGLGADVDLGPLTNPLIDLGATARHVVDTISGVFKQLWPVLQTLIPPVIALAVAFSPLHLILTAVGPVLPPLVDAFARLAVSLGTELAGALVTLMPALITVAHTLSEVLVGAVQIALPIVMGLFNFVSDNTWLIWAVVGAFVAWKTITGTIALVNGAIALTQGLMLGVTAASYGTAGSTYAVGAAQKSAFVIATIFNGTLWKQVAALVASKAQTVALVAMYTGGFIVSVARSIAGVVASTAAWVANTAAQVGAKAIILGGAIAMGVATAAQWLWNAAMDANPIGVIVMAIAGLVAGIVWVATQTTFFRDVWTGSMNVIGAVVGTVFGVVGGIIRGAFTGVVDFVKGIFNTIAGLVNGIIDGINGVTGLGAAIGINIGKIPHLPKLEKGGTVIQPGSVLVGEKGPEVLNLPSGASVVPLSQATGQRGPSLPENITLVDADGSIMARTHVVARRVTTRTLNQTLRRLA